MTDVRARILQALRGAGEDFVSGEELSRGLGISRTAVWKHIRYLQAVGYPIEAVRHRGYRLLHGEGPLRADRIQAGLATSRFGRHLEVLETVDSTNRYAFEAAERGAPEGYAVLAERQTGGKGRRGRPWFSPPGTGIWMSLVLRPPLPLLRAPQLTLMTAVSVAEAVRSETGVPVVIKWPNDLLLPDGRKVCGILLEMSAETDHIRFIVLGIGLNVFQLEEDFPEELRHSAGSLAMAGEHRTLCRTTLVQAVLGALERDYDRYIAEGGFAPFRSRWEALNATLGRAVSVLMPDRTIFGVARRIDDEGALWVETGGGRVERVVSAEVLFDGPFHTFGGMD